MHDEAGQWLGNYSSTGQLVQQAIWLDNYPVALINVPAVGVPGVAYIQPDHLGTPRVAIDPARNLSIWEWSSRSEVFGNQAPNSDPDGDGVAFDQAHFGNAPVIGPMIDIHATPAERRVRGRMPEYPGCELYD